MDKIKNVLEFIISLITTWKLVFPIIVVVFMAIGNLLDLGKRIVLIRLPLWIVIIISMLAFYPLARLFAYIINRSTQSFVKIDGLLWKKPILPFRYPQPYCPHENCGLRVVYRIKPPKSVQLMQSISDWENCDLSYHHYYECPNHGRLSQVPDEDINILQKKAKLVLNK